MTKLLSFKKTPMTIRHSINPFLPLQAELSKIMDDFYGHFEPFNFPVEHFENLMITPAIDIVEDQEQFKVEVEMPGMGEEDVKVSIDGGILTIKGEKSTSKKDEGKNYMMREISYGNYERRITLPDSVDANNAKASFKKGMLWVTIPKKAACVQKPQVLAVEKAG